MTPGTMKQDAELRGWATDNKVGARKSSGDIVWITSFYPKMSGQFGATTEPSKKGSCRRIRAGLPRNAKEAAKQLARKK